MHFSILFFFTAHCLAAAAFEEHLAQGKEIALCGKGRQATCRSQTESSLDVALKGQDCVEQPLQTPELLISQSEEMVDQDVTMQVIHANPLQIIEIQATTIDQNGVAWNSQAFFQADEQGCIQVNTKRPLQGSSYSTIDGMGLFWSMTPQNRAINYSFQCQNDYYNVELTLRQHQHPIETQMIRRNLKKSNVQKLEVMEHGLIGKLFVPESEKPLPVIITLNGSNGGLDECKAKLLASSGFAVFALGYFGVGDLPNMLQDIALEYFENAFTYLKNHPAVDSSRIGLYGISRGAELALLLGSLFPTSIQAIAAVVPSSVVYGSFGYPTTDAWIYKGSSILPYAPIAFANDLNGKGKHATHPTNTCDSFLEGMQQKEAFEAAAIPVENIICPLLLISSGDDQVWPSALYSEQILNRLSHAHSIIPCLHLHYPEAGHDINIPNIPLSEPIYHHSYCNLWFTTGGTRAANADASRSAWRQIVMFFHKAFEG